MSKKIVTMSLLLSLLLAGVILFVLRQHAPGRQTEELGLAVTLQELRERLAGLEEKIDQRVRGGGGSGVIYAAPEAGEAAGEAGGAEAAAGAGSQDNSTETIEQLRSQVEALSYRVRTLEEDPINRGYSFLDSESPELRERGINQLRRLARFDPAAREAIRDMLNDPSPRVKRQALDALGDMQDKESIPYVANLLNDADANVRREAIESLGKLQAKETGPEIAAMLQDPSENVREEAADMLGRLKVNDASNMLIKALSDANDEVRGEAIASLGEIGAKDAAPFLREIYENDPGKHKIRLIRSLKTLGDAEPFNREIKNYSNVALNNENPRFRRDAVRMLSWLAREQSTEVFKKVLKDPSEYVRREAQRALEQQRRQRR